MPPHEHVYSVDLPVLFAQVYCCSITLAQSQSEHDDASEMVGGRECSAISSWRALPGRESSAPALHSSLYLHLYTCNNVMVTLVLFAVISDHYHTLVLF